MKTTYYSSPAGRTEPRNNHLLAALPAADYQRLLPHLRLVPLNLGQSIYEPGEPRAFVYFPTTSIVSLLYTMEDGFSADIAITGNEGMVGISVFMGGDSTPSYVTVLSEGEAYRLKADIVKREFKKCGVFNQLSLRYTQALITQMAQTAVCYRHHIIDKQLCRWLLMSLDRLSSSELTMTQELISHMLGTRREGVTEAASKLRSAGLIAYQRGLSPCWTLQLWRIGCVSVTPW